MGKTILNHNDHAYIIATTKSGNESEHAVCVRLAAKFGCGKARIYELRHGIHTPPCCLPQTGGLITPAMVRRVTVKRANTSLFNKTNPAPAPTTSDLPIVGFRMWNFVVGANGPRLQSYNSHFGEWVPGEKYVATCGNGTHAVEKVPSQKECCGAHAYKKKTAADLLARSADGILGAVIMYGTVRENTEGYRAQFARPICFAVAPAEIRYSVKENDIEAHRFELRTKRTEKLAKEYGVPVVPYEHIELCVSEFGRLLPIGRG